MDELAHVAEHPVADAGHPDKQTADEGASSALARYAEIISSKGSRRISDPKKKSNNGKKLSTLNETSPEWNAPDNLYKVGRQLIKVLFPVVKSVIRNKSFADEAPIQPTQVVNAYLHSDVLNAAIVLLAVVDDPHRKIPEKFTGIGRLCGRLLIEVIQELSRCQSNNSDAKPTPTSVPTSSLDGLFRLYQVCLAFYNRCMRSTYGFGDASGSDSEDDAVSSEKANLTDSSVAFDFIPPLLIYLMRINVPKFTDSECRTIDPLLRYVEHAKFFLRKTAEKNKSGTQTSGRAADGEESDDSSLFDELEPASSQQRASGDNYLRAFDRDVVQAVVTSIRIFMLRTIISVDDQHLDKALQRLARIMTANDEICDYCHTTIKLVLCQPMTKAQEARATRAYGLLYKLSWLAMRKRVKESEDGLVALLHMIDNTDLNEMEQHLEQNITEIISMCVNLSNETSMLMRVQSLVRSWREVVGSRTSLEWRTWLFERFHQHMGGANTSPDERIRRNFLWLMAVFFPFFNPTWTRTVKDSEAEGQLKMIRELLMDSVADVRLDAISTSMAILQHSWQACSTASTRGIVNDVAQLCYDQHNLKVRLRAIEFFIELIKKRETHAVLKKAVTNLKPLINDTNLTVVQTVLRLYEQIFDIEQRYKNTITSQETEQQLVRLRDACDLPVLMSMFNSKTLLANNGANGKRRRANNDPAGDDIGNKILVDVAIILRKYLIPKPSAGVDLFEINDDISLHKSNLRKRCLQLKNVDRSHVLTFYETFAKIASDVKLLDRCPPEFFTTHVTADAPVDADGAENVPPDFDANAENDSSNDEEEAESDEPKTRRRRGKGGKKAAAGGGKQKTTLARAVSKRFTRKKSAKSQVGNAIEDDTAAGQGQSDAENARLRAPRDELLLLITSLLSGLKYFLNAVEELSSQPAEAEHAAISNDTTEQRLNDKMNELLENDNRADADMPVDEAVVADRRAEYAKTLDEALYLLQAAGTMWDAAVFVGLNSELSAEGKAERIVIMQKFLRFAKTMLAWPALWNEIGTDVDSNGKLSMRLKFLPHALLIPLLVPRVTLLESSYGLPVQIKLVLDHLYDQTLYVQRHVAQFMCRVLWRTDTYRAEVVDFLFDCVCIDINDAAVENSNDDDSGVAASSSVSPGSATNSSRQTRSRSKSAGRDRQKSASSSLPRAKVQRKKRGAEEAAMPDAAEADPSFSHSRRRALVLDADRRAEAPVVGVLILHAFLSIDCVERSQFFQLLGSQRVRQLHEQMLKRLKTAIIGRGDTDEVVDDDIVSVVVTGRQNVADDEADRKTKRKPSKTKAAKNGMHSGGSIDEEAAIMHVKLLADLVSGFTGACLASVNVAEGDFNLEEIERDLISGAGWPELVESLVGTSNSDSAAGSRQYMLSSLTDLNVPVMGSSGVPSVSSDGNRNDKKTKPVKIAGENVQHSTDTAVVAKTGNQRSTRTTRNSNPDQVGKSVVDPGRDNKRRRGAAKTAPPPQPAASSAEAPDAEDASAIEEKNLKAVAPQHDANAYERKLRSRVSATLITCFCEMAEHIADNVELNAGFFNGFSTLLYLFDDLDLQSSTVLYNATKLASAITSMTYQAFCLVSFVNNQREQRQQRRDNAGAADAEPGPLVTPPASPRRSPSPANSVGESTICNTESKIEPLVHHAAKMLARLLFARQFIDARWFPQPQHTDAERKRFLSTCMQAQKAVDKTLKQWCNAWARESDDSYRILVLRELAVLLTAPLHAQLLRQAVVTGDDIAKRVVAFFARCAVDWPQDKQIVMEVIGKIGDALAETATNSTAAGPQDMELPQTVAENSVQVVAENGKDVRFKWLKMFSTHMILYVKVLAVQGSMPNNNNI